MSCTVNIVARSSAKFAIVSSCAAPITKWSQYGDASINSIAAHHPMDGSSASIMLWTSFSELSSTMAKKKRSGMINTAYNIIVARSTTEYTNVGNYMEIDEGSILYLCNLPWSCDTAQMRN